MTAPTQASHSSRQTELAQESAYVGKVDLGPVERGISRFLDLRNIARQRAFKGWKLSRPLKVVPAGLNIAGNRRLAMDVCGLVTCIVDQGQHRPHGPHHKWVPSRTNGSRVSCRYAVRSLRLASALESAA
jgi:hypothetical protein